MGSFQILAMFRRGLFYSYLSIYLRFFLELSVTETTLFATLPMIFNVIFQNFVWGYLSDRMQLRRTLIIIGEISAAISTVLVWYLHILPEDNYTSGYIVIFGLAFVEIFWSMSNVGWTALISDLYPADERAGLQGRLQGIGALGRFAGVLIGGLLYDGLAMQYEGWGFYEGPLFFIASSVMLISTIPMLFVPEGGIVKAEDVVGTGEKDAEAEAALKKSTARKFRVFLIAMVCIYFGLNSIVLLKSQYLTLESGFDISSQTLSYIFNMATLAIFLWGIFIKPISKKVKDEYLLMFGVFTAVLYLLGYMLSPHVALIFCSEFFGGSALAIIMASSYSYASRLIPPEKRGKQFALFNATHFLSWGLPGTLMAGPLVDFLIRSGYSQVFSYKMAFLAAVILISVGAFVLSISIRLGRN